MVSLTKSCRHEYHAKIWFGYPVKVRVGFDYIADKFSRCSLHNTRGK